MAIHIDPVTRQRVIYDKHNADFNYFLDGNSSVSREDVVVIGDWEDFTGSAVVNSASQQQFAGTSNELFGTDPGLMGNRVGQLNEVGKNKQTHRRRRILRRANLTDGKGISN